MSRPLIREKIKRLSSLDSGLYNGDFLSTWAHGTESLRFVMLAAEILRDLTRSGISTRAFDGGVGVSIFRDQSTRTRYAFRAACDLVGLSAEEIDESRTQIGHGETVRETAAMLGFLTEVIGIRDDLYPAEGHRYMADVASSLEEAYCGGALIQRPAVINLQSDLDHPTQSLADLCHLAATFGGLDALKGKRLAMSWAYSPSYGKPLSVPQGIIALMTRFGMKVVLAHPKGYELMDEPLTAASSFASESGGSFSIVDSMDAAFEKADIVYPKSWAPASVMRERTRALRSGEAGRLAELERDALARNAQFKDWECTSDRMRKTNGGKALYMHCLPADVSGVSCATGEVSRDVFERTRLDTYREAGYKPFVIAAMILSARLKDPAGALSSLLETPKPKRLADPIIA